MAVEKLEIETYFGRCKCCRKYGYLRTMWEQHVVEKTSEIYGRMLTQCFSIPWTTHGSEEEDQICEECIWKLREADNFRKQVLLSQHLVEKEENEDVVINENEIKNEIEFEDYDVEYLDEELLLENHSQKSTDNINEIDNQDWKNNLVGDEEVNLDNGDESNPDGGDEEYILDNGDEEYILDNDEENILDNADEDKPGDVGDKLDGSDDDSLHGCVIFREVNDDASIGNYDYDDDSDYKNDLEEETEGDEGEELLKVTPAPRKRKPASKTKDKDQEVTTFKWAKKLPKEERQRTYKQYTEETFNKAVEVVLSKDMNQKQAAKKFQVPRKTLGARVNAIKNKKSIFRETKTCVLITEIKTLMNYLNVVPFRVRANRTQCFYCLERPDFNTPDDMRVHTRTQHPDRIERLEHMMRPTWNNEIIKLDIKDIACHVCDESLGGWKEALDHMKDVHSVKLQEERKIIPFVLNKELSCALCYEPFSAFTLLDAHMNTHYKNYMCGHCGEPFITTQRLYAHEKIHDTGRYPCRLCNKVFTLEKYMKKHISFKHLKEFRVKCNYCSEVFKNDNARHAHVVLHHKEHVETIVCGVCGHKFNWMRNYVRHMKRTHLEQLYCEQCGKFLPDRKQFLEHHNGHKGVKEYRCYICSKKYSSAGSLKSHVKYSHKDHDVDSL